MNTATFGAGCFWGVEKAFRRKYGPFIHSILVGYTGGHTQNPTYKQVCSGTTGHAEVVQLVYDSSKVSFADLVDFFYRMHEPHTVNRQGNDVGTQYRSAIFYHDNEQKKVAESVTEKAQKYYGKVQISTTIEPAGMFFKAEDYHQDYLTHNPHGYEALVGENTVVLSINMSDRLMESDLSKLKDVLSKVVSTEKALNEYTNSSDAAVNDNLVKLREFISEAKATLSDATLGYDDIDALDSGISMKPNRSKPPLRPYVQKVSEQITEFNKRFKIIDFAWSQVGSIFYADIVILYASTILWNWLVPLPRLEWLIFTGLSLGSFFRAFLKSRAIFSNAVVLIVAAALQLSYLQQQYYGRLWGDIDLMAIINSILIYQISLNDLRGDDPNAQGYWIAFIILDMYATLLNHSLFKSDSNSIFVSFICCYTFSYCFMMFWIRANSYALEKKADEEAAGTPGYSVEGKLERTWSWNGQEPETFYSNQFQKEDRFELNIQKLSHNDVLFSYIIPRSLAASLCTERDYKNIYRIKPKGSYNITALVKDFPEHYILRRDIVISVNNQNWDQFNINVNLGTILISGLEEGKGYKIFVEIEGYRSVSTRIRTSSYKGKWDRLKYINAQICNKAINSHSRSVSQLSFMDLNKDLSFSFEELEGTPSKASDLSFENSELPASSKTGKFSEMELNEHLSKMIKREKDSLKTIETKISKVKSETMKEYNSLQKTLDGIIKISSKAEGQNERYRSKCRLYEDIIKEAKDMIPKLRTQISHFRTENIKFDDDKSKLAKEIEKLTAKVMEMQTKFQEHSQNQKIELDTVNFENSELKNTISMHRSNLSSIFLATQKLSDPTYPSGIHAMSAQLEVYEARYQRKLELKAKSSWKSVQGET